MTADEFTRKLLHLQSIAMSLQCSSIIEDQWHFEKPSDGMVGASCICCVKTPFEGHIMRLLEWHYYSGWTDGLEIIPEEKVTCWMRAPDIPTDKIAKQMPPKRDPEEDYYDKTGE